MNYALLLAPLALASCATHWQRYDESGYDVVMDPSGAPLAKHIGLLEEWTANDTAVPPGIYAELGYWLAKAGRSADSRTMFEREVERYPYAKKYVAVLMALVLPGSPDAKAIGDRPLEIIDPKAKGVDPATEQQQ